MIYLFSYMILRLVAINLKKLFKEIALCSLRYKLALAVTKYTLIVMWVRMSD